MADNTVEEWRAIEQAPDYAVSNLGRVKRLVRKRSWAAGGIMSATPDKDGYFVVALDIGKKRINKLVCEAFNGRQPSASHHAAHWDGDRGNNCAANLRWATAAENAQDKIRHGRTNKGDKHPFRLNAELAARGDKSSNRTPERRARRALIQQDLSAGNMTQRQIARKYNVSDAMVSKIKLGQSWK